MGKLNKTAVSDIPFVQVKSALQTIEVRGGLTQISDASVSSFYFGKQGLDNLIRRKYRTLNELAENRCRVRELIDTSKYPLSTDVAIVATSMVITISEQIMCVKEQISRGVLLAQFRQEKMHISEQEGRLVDDEIPF
ncbi:MAG: hypothetical protein FVQ79_12700 [Planctomycetes bacterium]|nr:hypothetical protein [Planctomycetota bacterium]